MISEGIGALLPDAWPADPLWICAVRQSDGRRVVFGRGDRRPRVADAVAASCAIPGFFAPVVIDGEAHLDGGVHSPTNADVLRGEDLDLVIVSSPMSRRGRRPRLSRRSADARLGRRAPRCRGPPAAPARRRRSWPSNPTTTCSAPWASTPWTRLAGGSSPRRPTSPSVTASTAPASRSVGAAQAVS